MLGVSLVLVSLVPGRARWPASRSASRTPAAGAGARRPAGCCRGARGRRSSGGSHGLLDLDRRRADGRRRRGLDDHLQRRPAPRALMARARPRSQRWRRSCGSRWRIRWRSRFRTGDDAGDVHARRLHARDGRRRRRARSSTRSRTRRRSAAASTSRASTAAPRRSTTCRRQLQRTPGVDAGDFTVVGSQSVPARRGAPARHGPRPSRTIPCAASTQPFLAAHDVRARRARARLRRRARGVGRDGASSRTSPSSTGSSCRAATTSTSRCCRPTSASPASTTTTARFDPIPSRSATRRPGATHAAHGHRRARGHRAARDGRHLDLAGDARRRVPRRAPRRPSTTSDRARRRPGRRGGAARVGVPGERHGGRVDPARRRRGDRRLADVQPADPGLHGARAGRRRRGARRHQRPRGRRAPPADRRPARDRLPPAAWWRRCSCSSRRSSR